MPDFSEYFEQTKGKPIQYKGQKLFLADKFPISDGDTLVASIEKTNSDYKQGFCIDITGSCEMNGEIIEKGKGIRMLFWEDTAPPQIKLKVFTKKDFVWIENIWKKTSLTGHEIVDYGHFGSAMIVEEIENGKRYRCNDWHPDENFDDIVFTIQKL